MTGQQKSDWLTRVADRLVAETPTIIDANQLDLARAEEFGLSSAMIDRLTLTPPRLEALAQAVEEINALPDPVGEIIDGSVRPNGLKVTRLRVPLGSSFSSTSRDPM